MVQREPGLEQRVKTHPDAQFHVLTAVDLHAFVQQADLLKVLPVHYKAANESRTPGRKGGAAGGGGVRDQEDKTFYSVSFSKTNS